MKKNTKNLVIVTTTLLAAIYIHRKYKMYQQVEKSLRKINSVPNNKILERPQNSYIKLDYTSQNSKTDSNIVYRTAKEVEFNDQIFEEENRKRKYYTLPFHNKTK